MRNGITTKMQYWRKHIEKLKLHEAKFANEILAKTMELSLHNFNFEFYQN